MKKRRLWIIVKGEDGIYEVYHPYEFFESSDEQSKMKALNEFYNQTQKVTIVTSAEDVSITPITFWVKGNNSGIRDVIVLLCIRLKNGENEFIFVPRRIDITLESNMSENMIFNITKAIVEQELSEDAILSIRNDCQEVLNMIANTGSNLLN